LEHNSCIKGKGLEGEYVYVWNHTELFLMPTNADIYTEVVEYNKTLESAIEINAKDLQPGYTYLTKKNEKYVYLEKHERLDYDNQSEGQFFWFAEIHPEVNFTCIRSFKSIKGKFINVYSTELPENFDKMDKDLKNLKGYKPYKLDYTFDEIVKYEPESEFLKNIEGRIQKYDEVYIFHNKKYKKFGFKKSYNFHTKKNEYTYYLVSNYNKDYDNLEEFKDCKFFFKNYKKKK
jgi:hypothetical protein